MSNEPNEDRPKYKVEEELEAVREEIAIQDGFRPRRKRPKGWLEQAIKDGSVRDPKLGPNPDLSKEYDLRGFTVVDVPLIDVNAKGE